MNDVEAGALPGLYWLCCLQASAGWGTFLLVAEDEGLGMFTPALR